MLLERARERPRQIAADGRLLGDDERLAHGFAQGSSAAARAGRDGPPRCRARRARSRSARRSRRAARSSSPRRSSSRPGPRRRPSARPSCSTAPCRAARRSSAAPPAPVRVLARRPRASGRAGRRARRTGRRAGSRGSPPTCRPRGRPRARAPAPSSPGTRSTARSLRGSNAIACARARSRPSGSTRVSSWPATTCALVTTTPGSATQPEPSTPTPHAVPRIFTTARGRRAPRGRLRSPAAAAARAPRTVDARERVERAQRVEQRPGRREHRVELAQDRRPLDVAPDVRRRLQRDRAEHPRHEQAHAGGQHGSERTVGRREGGRGDPRAQARSDPLEARRQHAAGDDRRPARTPAPTSTRGRPPARAARSACRARRPRRSPPAPARRRRSPAPIRTARAVRPRRGSPSRCQSRTTSLRVLLCDRRSMVVTRPRPRRPGRDACGGSSPCSCSRQARSWAG